MAGLGQTELAGAEPGFQLSSCKLQAAPGCPDALSTFCGGDREAGQPQRQMAGMGASLRGLDAKRNDLLPGPQFAHYTKMEEPIGPQNNLGHRGRVSLVSSRWD